METPMRLPLAGEIAHARAAFEEAHEALLLVTQIEHALTATHLVMAGEAKEAHPGADLLARLAARWPAIQQGSATIGEHERALREAHALLGGLAADLATRNAALSDLLHEQSHLAMDPAFDDLLVELAELDARHKGLAAEIEAPYQRLHELNAVVGPLETTIALAEREQRPAEDPLGVAGFRAGHLATAVAEAAQELLRAMNIDVELPAPPDAPETLDAQASDTHWASLTEVSRRLRRVLHVMRADAAEAQQILDVLSADQKAVEREVFRRTG